MYALLYCVAWVEGRIGLILHHFFSDPWGDSDE